jgi:hypothetical protein
MQQDWIFKNDAGYIGESFFCFSSSECRELIRYQDLRWIEIHKKRHLFSWVLLSIVLLFLTYLNFHWNIHQIIKISVCGFLLLLTGVLFYIFPFYSYHIKIFFVDKKSLNCKVPSAFLLSYIELVKMIQKVKKKKQAVVQDELLMMSL